MKIKTILLLSILITVISILAIACAPQANSNSTPVASLAGTNTNGQATASVGNVAQSETGNSANSEVSFSKDILPILQNSCVECHGGEKTARGLNLKTYDGVMAGSSRGPVVFAGDASGSKLVLSVQMGSMPKRGTKLTSDQIQLLMNWVNAGAPNN